MSPEPQFQPQFQEMSPSDMITQKSGISIAVVTVLISGVIANVTMTMSMKGDVALLQRDIEYVVRDVQKLTDSVDNLTDETRTDILEIHDQIMALSSRVHDLEQ